MTDIKLNSAIELIESEKFSIEDNEAIAAISLNPAFQWAKIVITDDQPNANKHRIPLEEFGNLVKTGIFAPIKMSESSSQLDHENALGRPIGAITQIVQSNNRLIALAALWKRERPEDIDLLKKMYQDGNPPNVSWEIAYAESKSEENGVEALFGTVLNGLAVVSNPAYTGRTPIIAFASENVKEENVEELEQLKQKISELEAALASKEEELAGLRTFKETVEAEKAKELKLASIKNKFNEAKIEKDEQFWTEKAEMLLGMEETAIDFMIQELVAFSSSVVSETEATKKVSIPDIKGNSSKKLSPSELGKALRERNLK